MSYLLVVRMFICVYGCPYVWRRPEGSRQQAWSGVVNADGAPVRCVVLWGAVRWPAAYGVWCAYTQTHARDYVCGVAVTAAAAAAAFAGRFAGCFASLYFSVVSVAGAAVTAGALVTAASASATITYLVWSDVVGLWCGLLCNCVRVSKIVTRCSSK